MIRKMFLGVVFLAFLAPAAMAQPGTISSIGPRVGFSADPDQFVFGGQATLGPVAPNLMFAPGIDVGVGDHVTVVSGNFDLHYHFTMRHSEWSPYVGAGMGVNNEAPDRRFGSDLGQTNVGGNLLFGVTAPSGNDSRFFTELKLGLGDTPSMKMMAGWNFGI
jgi:hypothetical protein